MAKERWVLVLGCSMGTGGAIAHRLGTQDGFNVLGMHRGNHPEEAERLRREVEAAGMRCELLVADAGRLDAIGELVARVAEIVGPDGVELVVHATADASPGRVLHPDPERQLHPKQVVKTFEIMAHSFLVWGQQLFAAGLLPPGSQILALPNLLDHMILPGFCAVGAAKAALNTYISYMALEMGVHGVRVNGLRFAVTPTGALSRMPFGDAALAVAASMTPAGRVMRSEEVADFVALMVDGRTAWLNGAIIDLGGGSHLAMASQAFGIKP